MKEDAERIDQARPRGSRNHF